MPTNNDYIILRKDWGRIIISEITNLIEFIWKFLKIDCSKDCLKDRIFAIAIDEFRDRDPPSIFWPNGDRRSRSRSRKKKSRSTIKRSPIAHALVLSKSETLHYERLKRVWNFLNAKFYKIINFWLLKMYPRSPKPVQNRLHSYFKI